MVFEVMMLEWCICPWAPVLDYQLERTNLMEPAAVALFPEAAELPRWL